MHCPTERWTHLSTDIWHAGTVITASRMIIGLTDLVSGISKYQTGVLSIIFESLTDTISDWPNIDRVHRRFVTVVGNCKCLYVTGPNDAKCQITGWIFLVIFFEWLKDALSFWAWQFLSTDISQGSVAMDRIFNYQFTVNWLVSQPVKEFGESVNMSFSNIKSFLLLLNNFI